MPRKPVSSNSSDCPPAAATPAEPVKDYRCWICLGDEEQLDDMISPCACVGTSRYVHQASDQVTHSGPTLSTVAQPRSLPRPTAPGVGLAQPPSPTGAHVARLGACTSPVGTLHQACVKDYCLTHLAMHPSPELRVACPICRSDYRIVPRGVLRRASGVKLPSL